MTSFLTALFTVTVSTTKNRGINQARTLFILTDGRLGMFRTGALDLKKTGSMTLQHSMTNSASTLTATSSRRRLKKSTARPKRNGARKELTNPSARGYFLIHSSKLLITTRISYTRT